MRIEIAEVGAADAIIIIVEEKEPRHTAVGCLPTAVWPLSQLYNHGCNFGQFVATLADGSFDANAHFPRQRSLAHASGALAGTKEPDERQTAVGASAQEAAG